MGSIIIQRANVAVKAFSDALLNTNVPSNIPTPVCVMIHELVSKDSLSECEINLLCHWFREYGFESLPG